MTVAKQRAANRFYTFHSVRIRPCLLWMLTCIFVWVQCSHSVTGCSWFYFAVVKPFKLRAFQLAYTLPLYWSVLSVIMKHITLNLLLIPKCLRLSCFHHGGEVIIDHQFCMWHLNHLYRKFLQTYNVPMYSCVQDITSWDNISNISSCFGAYSHVI